MLEVGNPFVKPIDKATRTCDSGHNMACLISRDDGVKTGMLTDNPIDRVSDDAYGFAAYARLLADAILETPHLPFSVGIFGAWGTGKSSFLHMIEEMLRGHQDVRSIWFNPWKYDKKDELWHALIQTVLFTMAKDLNDRKVTEDVVKLAKATTWLAIKKSVSAVSSGIITEDNLDKLVSSLTAKDQEHYRHINQFESDFERLVDKYTNSGRLVVFIDDLDRCLPENAITVLESLKLFIGNARCIFILGIDHYVVEEGIKYRFQDKIRMTGRDYLDKIIQIPFYLPPVPFVLLRDSVQSAFPSETLSEEIWCIIHEGMIGNPRKTKRFINCFLLLRHLLANQGSRSLGSGARQSLAPETQDVYLAKLLVFQMTFPDFYAQLQIYPSDWEYLERRVIQVEDAEKRQGSLQDRPDLEALWQHNPYFQSFMRKTSPRSEYNFPSAPGEEVVSALLQATSLVTNDNVSPNDPSSSRAYA